MQATAPGDRRHSRQMLRNSDQRRTPRLPLVVTSGAGFAHDREICGESTGWPPGMDAENPRQFETRRVARDLGYPIRPDWRSDPDSIGVTMNRNSLFALSLGIAGMFWAAQHATAQTTSCAAREMVVARLADRYGESRQGIGLGQDN